jgi:hypothetical protein
MRQTFVLSALLWLGLPVGIASAACEGRYEGLVTVKSAQGMSVAPLQWTVRDGKLFGGFEGPNGLYMVEATVDAKCKIVLGYANDYDVSAPMLVEGTVTEGSLKHNGPVTVTYKVELLPPQ